ncbi:MAG: formylglycine-generating enzyme family protein, partial [Planctomycetota bacterium]|nr:formylglycine-generating enzyme family protein [Planctomycetota bacterium]
VGAPDESEDAPPEPKERVAPPMGPGGMVYVPGGRAVVGTLNKRIIDLTRGRDQDVLQLFLLETPQHRPLLGGFFLDRYEVTNAQYYKFLQSTAVTTYDTTAGTLGTIDEIAASVLRLSPSERKARDILYWRQLYFANKEALWEAFGKINVAEGKTKLDELKFLRGDGTVDENRTAEKFRFESLPRGITLTFYNRRPPFNWDGIKPIVGEWNHPVRDVSYLDAQRFAEWAGKHIPTEKEWEYAARGPQGLQFPWGNDLPTEKEAAKQRGNWGANYISQRTYVPVSVPVDAIPGSASWCGAYHLVGNVAEWTSSWFKSYPGYRRNSKWNNRLGETIKIVRGSHAESREILVLRPAARNFIGSGPKAPPYPGNRFKWVGFRCAWSPKAGQNHLEPIVWRAVRGRRIKEGRLAKEQFVGSVIENFAEAEAQVENHVYVLGESKAIVLVPMRGVLWETGDEWMQNAWKKARRFRKTKDLAKRSTETETPRIVLGILHTDIGLDNVQVRKPLTAEERKKRPRGRGRKRAPKTIPGEIRPGTYLLTLWHGRLALANESLEFEAFISKEKEEAVTVVNGIDRGDPPTSQWELDNLADEGKFEFHLPLGGSKTDPGTFVKVSGLLTYEAGELDSAGTWRTGGGDNLPSADEVILPERAGVDPVKPKEPPPEEDETEDEGATEEPEAPKPEDDDGGAEKPPEAGPDKPPADEPKPGGDGDK